MKFRWDYTPRHGILFSNTLAGTNQPQPSRFQTGSVGENPHLYIVYKEMCIEEQPYPTDLDASLPTDFCSQSFHYPNKAPRARLSWPYSFNSHGQIFAVFEFPLLWELSAAPPLPAPTIIFLFQKSSISQTEGKGTGRKRRRECALSLSLSLSLSSGSLPLFSFLDAATSRNRTT